MACIRYELKPACLQHHAACGTGSPNKWRIFRRFKREPYIALDEKSMLSRHNHTKEIVSQDLAIGRLIPGSNPGILFSFFSDANHTSPLMRTIHNLMKGIIMEDQNKETTEVVETEEKKPNKIVQFVKDHKDRIRDITIGAAAAVGLALLIHLGKSEDNLDPDYDDVDWDHPVSDGSESNSESTDSSQE